MISLKNLVQLTLLLLLSAPLFSIPTTAQTVSPNVSTPPCGNFNNACPLGIYPSTVQASPGSNVTVNVVLNDTIGLIGWLIQVHFDFTVLKAMRVDTLDSNNVWSTTSQTDPTPPPVPPTPAPWTTPGCSTGNSYASPGHRITNSTATACVPFPPFVDANGIGSGLRPGCTVAASAFTGCVAEGQTLLGGITNITGTTGLTIFSIEFRVIGAGSSSIEVNSHPQIIIGTFHNPDFDLGCPSDGCQLYNAAPINGLAIGVGSAALIKSKVDVAIHHLKLSSGNVQTLSAIVGNTGTVPVTVRVDFVIVSEAGDVSFVDTGVLLLPVNTNGVLSVSYTVPSLPLRYHVIGSLTLSGDGSHFVRSGSTATTAYSVVL